MKGRRFNRTVRLPKGFIALIFSFVCAVVAWGNGFIPGLAKRDAPGPFTAAPIVQGFWNAVGESDLIEVKNSPLIGGKFYQAFDFNQGSIVFWVTPEWNGNDNLDHTFFQPNKNLSMHIHKTTTNNLVFEKSGGAGIYASVDISSWTAGTTYLVVVRWDEDNALDGVNYVSISIDDVHTFGRTSAFSLDPTSNFQLGFQRIIGDRAPANAVIEGLTIYRRSLFDGLTGTDVGNGDEINQIYNAGAGEDPTRITGSWDVVFCLPTNSVTGALSTGVGEAWSHPHTSNLLYTNTTNTGGFLLNGTYTADGWSDEGTPISVFALATAEKIFAGGYKLTTDATNEGIYQDRVVTAGDDWVVRALGHSDSTCQPKVILYDQTNLAEIGSITGTTTSTRAAPDVLILTGEAPVGSTTLRVKLINAAATGTCYWHQVEVLANSVTNPSMETWQGTDPDLPTGWVNSGMDVGQVTKETTTIHSGLTALRFTGGPDLDRATYRLNVGSNGDFYSIGTFAYYNFGPTYFDAFGGNGVWFRQDTLGVHYAHKINTDPATWKHHMGVARTDAVGDERFYVGQFKFAGDFIIDDFYAVALQAVSLTVTPASEVNSTENIDEIRVDGRDIYLGANAAGLGTGSGTIAFDWRPRHDAGQAVAFAETTSEDAYIVSLFGDVDDYINVYWDSPNTIRMAYSMAGTTASGIWDATGAIVAGTQYAVEVAYTGGGTMTLKVGGITRITLGAIPAAFGEAPDFAYYGSDSSGNHQGDATFSNTPTAVVLASFAANGVDGAVELRWETGSELDNLGFHLSRSPTDEGPYERITVNVIPGLGSSPAGAKYNYTDTGLTNGITYYYKLEDIETTGKTKRHGPVSATPAASGAPGAAPSGETSSSRITYGEPASNSLRVLKRGRRQVVLELVTEGFYAEPQEDGSVAFTIPDFAAVDDTGAASIPVKRTWVDAIAGRKVKVVSVQPRRVEAFTSLRPSNAGIAEIVATREGTVRAARRRASKAFRGKGLSPSRAARIVSVGFQGEEKKALVELAPLRWDASRGQLLLARRLVVRLSFREREPTERVLAGGKRGRRYARRRSHDRRQVVGRLATTEKGLHAVRYEEVMRGRRGVRAKRLRLSRQGEAVAFHLEPNTNRFKPGSVLYFVGEGAEANPYGSEAVYELEVGALGEAMVEVSAAPSGEAQPVYWHRAEWEEDRYYQAALVDAPDLWLWDLLFAPQTKSFPIEVSALAPNHEPPKLSVWLQGTSDFPAAPDHHVRVYVNGNLVEELSWDGKQAQHLEVDLAPGVLREGDNVLELENVGDTEAAYSMVMLDRYAVEYPRLAQEGDGRLEGRWSASGAAELSGFVAGSHVLDVSDAKPRWLTGTEVGADGLLRFHTEAGRNYLAVSPGAEFHPSVTSPRASRLKNKRNRADYLLIGPEGFLRTVTPLLQLRQSDGLKVKAVAIEEIYSEFGFGESTPEAVKDFLSYAYHEWSQPSPRYVVLLGDATFDFKDRLQTGVVNQVPPRMVKTSYLWTASDPSYAAVNGDDVLPDLAIGRLPAATVEELQVMVEKIVAYETGDAGLHRSAVVLVADNPDRAGNFDADANALAAGVLASRNPEKIFLSQLGTAATRNAIVQSFDDGASLVSYLGHGGIHLWADENFFNTGDVGSLAPQPQQPLLLTMNCLNGYFHFPYFNSLAEGLVQASDKGAIAAFSPSGLSLNGPANLYHQALLQELFNGSHGRLGDAVLAAQERYAATGAFPELLSIYHLLGDPALKLR